MNITIKGSGCLIPSSPIPDSILALAYPYFTIEDAPDGGLWFTLSPYTEVYDEDAIQTFLRSLAPYIVDGQIKCSLEIAAGHTVTWSYHFINSDCYRYHQSGSACSCINKQ